MILATGNMGPALSSEPESKNLYLSRNGGLNWSIIGNGVFTYEIGDHGAIIVIAKKNEPTNFVEFSWDEGYSWDKFTISSNKDKVLIENILIEPGNVS